MLVTGVLLKDCFLTGLKSNWWWNVTMIKWGGLGGSSPSFTVMFSQQLMSPFSIRSSLALLYLFYSKTKQKKTNNVVFIPCLLSFSLPPHPTFTRYTHWPSGMYVIAIGHWGKVIAHDRTDLNQVKWLGSWHIGDVLWLTIRLQIKFTCWVAWVVFTLLCP